MAKQSGIHLLKGKVGTMSYYTSILSPEPLARTIPDISNAVKSGENYANTRRTNSEFRMAANTASLMLKAVVNNGKYFTASQHIYANLVRQFMQRLKLNGTKEWGARTALLTAYDDLAAWLTYQQKVGRNDIFASGQFTTPTMTYTPPTTEGGDGTITLQFRKSETTFIPGVSGANMSIIFYHLYPAQIMSDGTYQPATIRRGDEEVRIIGDSQNNYIANFDINPAESVVILGLVTISPYRTVDGTNYPLEGLQSFGLTAVYPTASSTGSWVGANQKNAPSGNGTAESGSDYGATYDEGEVGEGEDIVDK